MQVLKASTTTQAQTAGGENNNSTEKKKQKKAFFDVGADSLPAGAVVYHDDAMSA
eukprot:COSAG06_NODE_21067_length_770_cov_8.684054_1_plen_55_part_00